jgi:1,4-alpha-glucan branching enzyme
MAEPLGGFCLVLHGHLPYVLRHGTAPHGAAWLYEAMAETYLPLLELIVDLSAQNLNPALTIGMTPILLEQLIDADAKSGFVAYVQERAARAADDRAQFLRQGDAHLAELAEHWEKWYLARLEFFERIGRDIAAQFASLHRQGQIQLLAGAATHAYFPLLLNDQSIRAQLSAGAAVSRRIIGADANLTGLWLPECGYRPADDAWKPAVLDGPGRYRPGIESFLHPVGVTHTFLDSHLIAGGLPLGLMVDGRFFAANRAHINRDRRSGWREALEPVGLASDTGRAEVFAFARHPSLTQQVWSSKVGYPGDGAYLEFHKKHGTAGLRYWRVTDVTADLANKEPYDLAVAPGRTYTQAQHFCTMVKDVLREYEIRTGRRGICVAAFDAELFGHWWFEGPRFLRDVILTLAADSSVSRMTAQDALKASPPDKVMRPMAGSWGRGGDHSVWLNDKTKWMWEIEYRAETELALQLRRLPWAGNPAVAEALRWAGRELLLLQASDWPFVVENSSALDYGIKRFSLHSTRFDRAIEIAESLAAGRAMSPVQESQLAEMKTHDSVFPEIDLNWWV